MSNRYGSNSIQAEKRKLFQHVEASAELLEVTDSKNKNCRVRTPLAYSFCRVFSACTNNDGLITGDYRMCDHLLVAFISIIN